LRRARQATPAKCELLPPAGILDHAPQRLTQQLLSALDIQAVYYKKDDQITIRATITTTTPPPSWPSSPKAPSSPPHSPPVMTTRFGLSNPP
jgi:hypothetical protein